MATEKSRKTLMIGYKLRQFKLRLQGIIYSGRKYYCPLCNKFYRKFLDGGEDHAVLRRLKVIGAGRRPNMVCPGCHSTDRDRLLHTFLCNNNSVSFPKVSMLHIAPEPALYKWIKKQYHSNPANYTAGVKYHEGFYYDLDINLIDITSLPYDDETFGLVMANHVLEHIKDESKALSEIFRVLKPDGKAILQVPWSPLLDETIEEMKPMSEKEREEYFGQHDHVRLYGRDFVERLTRAGFVVRSYALNELDADQDYLNCIAVNADELVFLASKQAKQ
ncbi:MAG TPA: methyltransferase domain-containing protein [Bacteroidales bacterium]|nr:methyltransferase domain-containing protein [Bacteroidales bacterium]